MKKHLFLMAALGLGLAACTNDVLTPEDNANITSPDQENSTSTLKSAKLRVFQGDQSRVNYSNGTRAEGDEENGLKPGELKLYATIENPDKEVFANYVDGSGIRYLSATSIFRNPTDGKYYATYHFQGNNYNTVLDTSIGGAIQVFSLDENGVVNVENGYTATNREQEDYDFNHIYFDNTANRIVVVGHKWSVPNSYTGDEPYTGENTRAIIGAFDPATGLMDYKTITTSIEVRDDNGMLIDHKDAGDGNCVTRSFSYPYYFVATKEGIAVLEANQEKLFEPVLTGNNTRYFIPTSGSCKYVLNKPDLGTRLAFLYLTSRPQNTASASTKANIAEFDVSTYIENNYFEGLIDPDTKGLYPVPNELNPDSYNYQTPLPEVTPIDGKNTISTIDDETYYVALSKGGLFYQQYDNLFGGESSLISGVLTFGDNNMAPVNCVYAEAGIREGYHRGYVYVANGASLTILDRASLQEVARYTLSAKDEINENEASANFIHVEIAAEGYPFKERTITVAYGQAGVRIFKFMPRVSPAWPSETPEL